MMILAFNAKIKIAYFAVKMHLVAQNVIICMGYSRIILAFYVAIKIA